MCSGNEVKFLQAETAILAKSVSSKIETLEQSKSDISEIILQNAKWTNTTQSLSCINVIGVMSKHETSIKSVSHPGNMFESGQFVNSDDHAVSNITGRQISMHEKTQLVDLPSTQESTEFVNNASNQSEQYSYHFAYLPNSVNSFNSEFVQTNT